MEGIDLSVLTQDAGPLHLPVWLYGAIGGGAFLVLMKLRGANNSQTLGASAVNPTLLSPGSQTPAQLLNPIGVGQNAAYDPNSGQIVESSNPFGGDFLSKLGAMFNTQANAPNNVTFAGPNGYLLTYGNGTSTFGNGANLQSGAVALQNSVNQGAAVTGFWNAWANQIAGYWQAVNTGVAGGQQIGGNTGPPQVPAILYQGGYPGAPNPTATPPIPSGR